jgi:Flp pilus assembly protein TadD
MSLRFWPIEPGRDCTEGTIRAWELYVLIAILIVAALLRLLNIGYYSLWRDEVNAINRVVTAVSASDLLSMVEESYGAAPLFALVLSGWTHLVGETSDFMARFPSFLAGVGGVVAIYFLGRRIFNGQVGLLAALLLTLSRFHVRYSQEVRFYALFMLLAACSMLALLRFIERRTTWRWLLLTVLHTVCFYSHYFTAFLIVFEGLYVSYLFVRSRSSSQFTPRVTWSAYAATGAAMVLAVVLFLPWFIYGALREPTSGELHTALDRQWFMSFLQPWSAGSSLSIVLFIAAFIAGVVHCVRVRRQESVLLLLIVTLSPFAALALVNRSGYFFASRQLLFALPSFLLLVAAGIGATAEVLGTVIGRFIHGDVNGACACMIAIVVFVPLDSADLHEYYRSHRGNLPDWKRAAAYLDENVGDNDLVVSMKTLRGGDCLRYYARDGLRERILDLIELPEWHNDQARTGTLPKKVWFATLTMPEFDPIAFDVFAFPHLKIVVRKKPVESWTDFWRLVSEYAYAAAQTTDWYKGRALSELTRMLTALGHNASAYEVARDLGRQYPDRPSYQRRLGEMAVKAGDMVVAVRAFRNTLELDPKSYAFSQLADVLIRLGKPDEAAEVVRKAVAANDEPYRRVRLGMVYAASGKHDRAEEEYRKAIAMQRDYEYAHYRLAQLYARLGRRDEAIAQFETVLGLVDPKSARATSVKAALQEIEDGGSRN